jgi:ketosteroid isomerase-like protein
MPEHQNAALVRRALDSLVSGDLATFCSAFADDVTWHVPGDGPLAGEYRGLPALLAFFARQEGLSDGTLKVALRDVMASDDHAVAWRQLTARRDSFALDVDEVLVFRIRDGRVCEVWQRTDQYPMDDFFSYGAARRPKRRHPQPIAVGSTPEVDAALSQTPLATRP